MSNSFKSIFKLSRIIKLVLVIIVLFAIRGGYNSVENALAQNYRANNTSINQQLPSLEKQQQTLKNKLKNAKHDQIIVNYHYKQAFSRKNSKDKTLKKWINKQQTASDRIDNINEELNTKNEKVNHLKSAYITESNRHNAKFNLTSIAIVLAAVLIFFILSF